MEHPERSAGTIFNIGDTEVLTVHQVVELCARELGADIEIVSMPYELAVPAWPLLAQPSVTIACSISPVCVPGSATATSSRRARP